MHHSGTVHGVEFNPREHAWAPTREHAVSPNMDTLGARSIILFLGHGTGRHRIDERGELMIRRSFIEEE